MSQSNRPESPQQTVVCRGVRGATSVSNDDEDMMLAATRELLLTLVHENRMHPSEIASMWLTTTPDLTACFPALAARQIGWYDVPMLCAHEMSVPGALPRVIRVMINWNTVKSQGDIKHVYLRECVRLRPDKVRVPPITREDAEVYLRRMGLKDLSYLEWFSSNGNSNAH
ncbi:MAG: chorismate mutase [Chloroflexota bacterium]